jgi:uracil-DNA glycosylase
MTAAALRIVRQPYDARAAGARCDECPLNKLTPVPPERPAGKPRYAAIAEHPGRYEEKLGRPLVGPSGQVFDRALTKVGLARREGHITNAILCRGEEEDDLQKAYECCAPRLLKELQELPPEAPILTMGAPATRTVLGVRSIFMARGFVWTAKLLEGPIKSAEAALRKAVREKDRIEKAAYTRKLEILRARDMLAGRNVFPTLNSAFILKADAWRPVLEIDIGRMKRWLTGELTKEKLHDGGFHLVVERSEEVRKALAKLRRVVSLDIETDGVTPLVSPILCVGLADSTGYTVVIGPWVPRKHARLLTDALKSRTACMHNGYNFDQIALTRDGVEFPLRPDGFRRVEDTLIAHHTFASHMYQRLDHVASVFCDCSPWKMIAGKRGAEEKGVLPAKMTPGDRHFYNAGDCRVQISSWDRMQVDLSRETEIYELDKKVAEICMQMQIDGIRRDPERMKQLIERMKRRNRHLAREMKRLANRKHFSPTKLADIRRALFGTLRAPVVKLTPKGLVSTSSGTLEALKGSKTRVGRFSGNLLDWRAIDKVRSTYLERIEVLGDGRVHPNWKSYGAVTGRFSCRLQSVPRLVFTHRAKVLLARGMKTKEVEAELGRDKAYEIESRIREVYVPDPGNVFIYYDLPQSEMKVAAYVSGDDAFINACESGDVHTANAKVLFASQEDAMEVLVRDPKGEGKFYRDVTKNAGFGILYKADVETIFLFLKSKGFDVELQDVTVMFDTLHETYHRYYKFCDERLAFCQKNGFLRGINSGRIRKFGFHPKPTDVYNFSIQEFVAYLMNNAMVELRGTIPRSVKIVGQWHDALVFESPEGAAADETEGRVREMWGRQIVCKSSGRAFVMGADVKRGYRLSDFC